MQNSHLPRHRKSTKIHRINSLAQCQMTLCACLYKVVMLPPQPIPAWRAIGSYFLSSFISCSVLLFCIRLSTNSVIHEPECVFSFTLNLLHITTYGTDFNIFMGYLLIGYLFQFKFLLTVLPVKRQSRHSNMPKVRTREQRAELRQKKYRYLYQVRTAHGDVISQVSRSCYTK